MLQERTQASTGSGTTRAFVMIIDDDELMAEGMTSVLQATGYRVEHCRGAPEALARLRAGSVPDLILLDLVMPRMSGWEFRVEQRREPGLASIPLIAMSADCSAQAAAIDADLYLTKPFENACLTQSVDQVLAAAQQARKEARDAELERLSSLGVLAAGIAHEINNPLTFVVGNLELAGQRLVALEAVLTGAEKDEVSAILTMLEKADRGAQRIAAVVRNVSAFARSDTDTLQPVDLVGILDSSIELVANEIRHHATLTREYGALPLVLGNPTKLGQVFVNLLTNAAHAVRDAVGAANREIAVVAHETPEGDVVVAISDTGQGIPPTLMARIFDPFFSTKPIGVGTGLGLAISHRLVIDMGGAMEVESVVGRGSTFRVTFPRSPQNTEPARRAAASLAQQAGTPKPRLLVIDDESMVCDLLVAMFEGDYQVEALVSPREGLARILDGQQYDVILCDLMMAELCGMEVHGKLTRAHPDQADRMIFMTGGTFTSRTTQFLDRLPGGYIQKPFVGAEVQDAVAGLLRRHGTVGIDQRRAN